MAGVVPTMTLATGRTASLIPFIVASTLSDVLLAKVYIKDLLFMDIFMVIASDEEADIPSPCKDSVPRPT